MRSFGITIAVAAAVALAPLSAQASFEQCIGGLRSAAAANGVSHATFDATLRGVTPDPEVLEKASRQPEFVTPIWQYLDSAVSDKRIEDGRRMLTEHRATFDAIERHFGVDRHVVAAIWGMESSYGQVLDNPKIVKSVPRSLATLACAGGRRAKFGRGQLLAALEILQRGDTHPADMTGSWAGAMGHTQFIPTTYNAYAVDFTGDGRRDIWRTIPDALASTANYLRKSGWQSGRTWGYEVDLPPGFDYRLGGRSNARPLDAWERLGVRRTGGRAFPRGADEAELVLPAGAGGPAFLMLKNYRAILRYNNAMAYGLAVGHLADRLMGGGPFHRSWSRDALPLGHDETREMQAALTRRGFSTGGVDGKIGPMTEGALRAWQQSAGLIPDGYASTAILERLRANR